jgi:hypothetical protein
MRWYKPCSVKSFARVDFTPHPLKTMSPEIIKARRANTAVAASMCRPEKLYRKAAELTSMSSRPIRAVTNPKMKL